MGRILRRGAVGAVLLSSALVLPGSALHPDWGLTPPGWPSFAYNSLHWARPNVAAQPLSAIHWQAMVEESGTTFGHYGSPLVTARNNVVFPVHRDTGGFRIEGRSVADGTLLWSLNSSYDPPSSGWMPVCQPVLTPVNGVAVPESGGRVLIRQSADTASSIVRTVVFYGAANYAANPAAYDNNVRINTPITCDSRGYLYFGYHVTGPTPINLESGIARIGPTGGVYLPMSAAAGDPSVTRAPHNCAPALGPDGRTLYIGARDGGGGGYLLCLDRYTFALLHRVRLKDPNTGGDADLTDFSTASPMIAPDGQVFYGVLDAGLNNNDRGWLLHFTADLSQPLAPGAFGWDNTPSVFPATSCALYTGPSPYLLMCKYNNYAGIGSGDGVNKIAVLDPGATQADPVTGVTIMKEVITHAGVTPDPPAGPNAVREWCINTCAIDWIGHAAMANSEDGKLYKWDFDTNTLPEVITLTGGVGEAYTPTLIARDGTVFAINDKMLFAVGK
ncbi:MAG: hypothetical protein IT437_12175 [Phycisphaerales bacterium]|nr:hypothetical protein [Phycisphaerales bacterium]